MIWVVLRGGVENLHSNCAYIREYAAPDALRMEAQYFFTNIEIATTFIESAEASYFQGISPDEFEQKMAEAERAERQNSRSFGSLFRRTKK